MAEFKNRIRELRKVRDISIRKLAEDTGLDNSIISKIERGERRVNIRVAQVLADYFGVSVDFLLGRDVGSRIDDFMKELLKIYNQYESNEDPRSSSLAYIMKSIYEMSDSDLEEVRRFVAYLSARADFS